MSKRPMFFLALAVSGGVFLQHALSAPPAFLAAAFLALFFLALAFYFFERRVRAVFMLQVLLLLLVVCSGMLRLALEEYPAEDEASRHADEDGEVLLLGTVAETPRPRREHWRFALSTQGLCRSDARWINVQGKVLVSGRKLESLALGEQVLLRGRLRLPDEARNPGAFDYRLYLKAHEIRALFWCSQDSALWRSEKPSRLWIARALAQARAWFAEKLARFSRGQSLAVLEGLLLGQRDEIDDEVIASFTHTGLIHVLAVSGLHVGFIALMLHVLADFLQLAQRWRGLAVVLGLFFYAALTGAQPPVVRATIMATALLLARPLEREGEIYNGLGLAAFAILMWQPWQLFQLGFLLSFAAVWGIAYLYRPLLFGLARVIRWRWRPARWALAVLAVSFAAQFATLPFIVTAYGRLPVTAIWGNLIVIPASFLAVATGLMACLCAPLSEFLLQVYGAVAEVTVTGMIHFTRWLARLPGAYVEAVPGPFLVLIFYLLLLVAFVEWRRRVRPWVLVAALAVLNVFVWREAWHAAPKLRLTFFDVGQGDAALLEFPDDRRLLIDAGPWHEYTDAAERVLLPYFAKQGIRRLQAAVITHPHADHLGGLPSLLASWLQIDTVYWCGIKSDSELEKKCERRLDSLRVPRRALRRGETLTQFEPAQIAVLASGRKDKGIVENLNNASTVLKVVWGETALLFAGDAEWQSEWRMTRHAGILDSDLLKVAHHGSKTSSTLPFLQAVTPHWAVTSVGRRNQFRHPHPEVMSRLEALGIQNIRTDLNGAVIFEADGKALKRLR